MKKALVEFIVQIPDGPSDMEETILAMDQAERYLNTGSRCVDFNIRFLSSEESGTGAKSLICRGRSLPVPAEHIGGDE